jgi:predicted dehydrogenase
MDISKRDVIKVRVLIVGCGNIAGRFDEQRPSDSLPFTHAGAYTQDVRFDIVACVDPEENRRTEFLNSWSVPVGYSSIEDAFNSNERFDVISICSPTKCHAHDLEIALCMQPKLIFCEKPVTPSLVETERIIAKCQKLKIPLAVNYTRRWDPDIVQLKADILSGKWGELRTVVGLYNKGILNNGSHIIDLLHTLVGPIKVVTVGKPVYDFFSEDPSLPVWLEGQQGLSIHLACADAQDYAVFELQFVFSHGILTMEDGGMFWRERRAIDSVSFKGYRKLEKDVRRIGRYPQAMLNAVDNIYRTIEHKDSLASIGETAVTAQRVCEQVKQIGVSEHKF